MESACPGKGEGGVELGLRWWGVRLGWWGVRGAWQGRATEERPASGLRALPALPTEALLLLPLLPPTPFSLKR